MTPLLQAVQGLGVCSYVCVCMCVGVCGCVGALEVLRYVTAPPAPLPTK